MPRYSLALLKSYQIGFFHTLSTLPPTTDAPTASPTDPVGFYPEQEVCSPEGFSYKAGRYGDVTSLAMSQEQALTYCETNMCYAVMQTTDAASRLELNISDGHVLVVTKASELSTDEKWFSCVAHGMEFLLLSS